MAAALNVSAAAITGFKPLSMQYLANFAIVVVFPLPFIPTKQIIYGFFNLAALIMSIDGTSKRLLMLVFKESVIVSLTFVLGIGISTIEDLRSSFIFWITSTATLFSIKVTSRSQNNSSNCSSLI